MVDGREKKTSAPQTSITWSRSDIQSGGFYCLTVIGSTVIAGGYFGKGLYYSEDNGKTWKYSDNQSGSFLCLTIIVSKTDSTCTCIAGYDAPSSLGLIYILIYFLDKLYIIIMNGGINKYRQN